ncbi:hypothetical protein AYI68_g2506 [Smittium mucronatum]|uniref:Uncharacterized protein n=1 Tax=Smittium mucronatum TaxID=133383 RepID=A0A1R0H2H4_9FUNG|nr:hypothetical protein AYI68_g2506 [Smittium mucronatum]
MAHEGSAAMGLVASSLYWISFYSNIDLLYPVRPRSSEPLIYSYVAKKLYNSLVFPLYPTRGIDKPRYDALGIEEYNPSSILENLYKIFIALDV